MTPAVKSPTTSPLTPIRALAPSLSVPPTAISHYPASPLPIATLRLLAAHSTYLGTISTHISMLSSFLYLVLNLLKSSYHSYRHNVHVVVWCDVLLVGVNVMGVGCAMGYWCSYAERRRYEWEWDRRRTGKVGGLDGAAGVEGEVVGASEGWKGHEDEEAVGDDDFDITEGEVQGLLMQHSTIADEAPFPTSSAAAEAAPTRTALYPLSNFSAAVQHLFSAFTLTLFYSHTFYVSTLDGLTELLALSGAFLYLLSSLFPLVLDTHALALQEETEATLDEIGYGVDSLAMTLYVVSSLLYLWLYYRDRPVRDTLVWLDGGFWSNVWNVGGSFCYLFAIMYGLSIRLYMSSVLPPSPTASQQPSSIGVGADGGLLMGLNGTMMDGTVEADDLSDLSEWQRALFGLRSGEKLMTSTGDLMYMMCALMMEIADRQHRRRRMKGRKLAGKLAGAAGNGRLSPRSPGGTSLEESGSIGELAELAKVKGQKWSDSEKVGIGVGVIDVLAT